MEASIGVNLRVTAHSHQGGRKYMEDMFCVAYQPTADDRDLLYAYFGIFDGHGGREAALYAKHHLMDHIVGQKNFWSDDDDMVLKAIRDGFISTHYAMWKELEKWPKTPSGLPSTSGTTASIAFVRRGKLYIGHVGDSGIMMGYEDPETGFWRAKPLTKDHKPETPLENARISESGGKVIVKSGVPRVVWNRPRIGHKGPVRRSTMIDEIPFLAVARSLGDLWSYNSEQNEFVVSPCPDVSVLEIDVHSHRCLILGTDGLWNMLTPQDAVNSVYFAEKNNERQPQHLHGRPNESNDPLSKTWINPSKRLVDRALDRWHLHNLRADNTSVVTVVVDPPGPPKIKRSHVIRQSFSSTQDPTSSPVGISRYYPSHPLSNYDPSCGTREYFRHREAAKVAAAGVPAPAAVATPAQRINHDQNRVQGSQKPTLGSSHLAAPNVSVSHYTRAQRRGVTRRGVAPSNEPDSVGTNIKLVPGERRSTSASAFYLVPSQTRRDSHRTDVSNDRAGRNSNKSSDTDDVQIHEVSSSSEAAKSQDTSTSNHVVLRKRKSIKLEIPAERKKRRMEEARLKRQSSRKTTANSLTTLRNRKSQNSRGSSEIGILHVEGKVPDTTDLQGSGPKKGISRSAVAVIAKDRNMMETTEALAAKKCSTRPTLSVAVPFVSSLPQPSGSKKNSNRPSVSLNLRPKCVSDTVQKHAKLLAGANAGSTSETHDSVAILHAVRRRPRGMPTLPDILNAEKPKIAVDMAKALQTSKNPTGPVVAVDRGSGSFDITKKSLELPAVVIQRNTEDDILINKALAARAKRIQKKNKNNTNRSKNIDKPLVVDINAVVGSTDASIIAKRQGSSSSLRKKNSMMKSAIRTKKVLQGGVTKKPVRFASSSKLTPAAERSLRSAAKSAVRVTRSMGK